MTAVPANACPAWSPGDTARATLVVAAVLLAFATVLYFGTMWLLLLLGVVVATALRAPVNWLEHLGARHSTAVAVVFATAALGICLLMFFGLPVVSEQVGGFLDGLPEAYRQARGRLLDASSESIRRLAETLPTSLPWAMDRPLGVTATAEGARDWITVTGQVLFSVVAVMLLAFYLSLQEERTVRSLLLCVPATRREAVRELLEAAKEKMGAFVRAQGTLCILIGLLMLGAYLLIGLPYALPLAMLAAVGEAIPVLGLTLSAIPAALVALSVSPMSLLGLIIAIGIVHLLENLVLCPRIMGSKLGVHPIVTLLALAIFAALFGIVGAILSIPIAAIIQLLLDRLLLSRNAMSPAPPVGRDKLSLLRHEVQQLAEDVRLQFRGKDQELTPDNDRLEEAIEEITRDLEHLLSDERAARETAQISTTVTA